jgi:peptidoglycan hydrolase-like protein with peptidoglycan-binding domain
MTIDRQRHPSGLPQQASPPGSPADDKNEYAYIAAQLAARAERLAAAAPSDGPPEEPASQSAFSLFASVRAGHVWAAVLLLLFVGVSVLAVWGLPVQPSERLPSSFAQPAKAAVPSTDKPETKASPPASALPVAAAPVSAPQASPRTASPPPVAPPTDPLAVDSPALQMPSTARSSPAPLTPDEIRELQGGLAAAGFNPGAIDGIIGRQTRSAVREYAEARALPNADATRELLVRLKAEAPASVSSAADSAAPLTPDEIRDLQGRLATAGFNPGTIDGVIGRQTLGAVREYAEAQGIPNAAARDLLSRLRSGR